MIVEAEQFWPEDEPLPFASEAVCCLDGNDWYIVTMESHRFNLTAGDWIVKGIQGEFWAVKPDIFQATYEPVEVETGAPSYPWHPTESDLIA